ncbi:rubredoxin [Foetidibacter luteolus]|uniref:rubredoxin n=1 Tax=Foetidibacter luteolus TaxID=2608880 RepID=UPI001A9A1AB7|nr:rubredoxin [Foetidibacter luteolus]
MKDYSIIKINFPGGIISPGNLYNILVAAGKASVQQVRFGLRQQLLAEVAAPDMPVFTAELASLGIHYETDADKYPNILSSYPAAAILSTHGWLTEGIYKDVLDMMGTPPILKINLCDANQSFTPLLTGNINWVSSPQPHFWHLFIRFPKTNTVYEWRDLIYTNDVARMSKHIEELILQCAALFYDNPDASGDDLYNMVQRENYISKQAEKPVAMPVFNLPYYEGLNRYYDKYWLGIYRRDELYDTEFLKALCILCLETRIGLLCATPWKSLIIKNIEEKDRILWNNLLTKFQVNVRHAANELNFQVEDNCNEGLALKRLLVKHLNDNDTRTSGICIGIKTRSKSEIFSSILVKRRALLKIGRLELFYVYDILCAHDFNPNERTAMAFSKGNPKALLPEQLRRAILAACNQQGKNINLAEKRAAAKKQKTITDKVNRQRTVHQCMHCLTVYDEAFGEPDNNILPGTAFNTIAESYQCPLCEAEKSNFKEITVEETAIA